jgi:hypothetical protein
MIIILAILHEALAETLQPGNGGLQSPLDCP